MKKVEDKLNEILDISDNAVEKVETKPEHSCCPIRKTLILI